MLKKAIIALACSACVVCAVLFVCFFKGKDEVTFMQRQYINQYLASSPFAVGDSGEMLITPIAVASGTDGYGSGEFLGVRNQIDYGTGYIEVKVAVNDEGEAVLADSFSGIKPESASFIRVLKQAEADYADGLVVNLSEYSRLSAINYLLANSSLQSNCIVTGVTENAIEYVKRSFPRISVLCNYGEDNIRSLEEISQAGSAGILVRAEELDESVVAAAKELGLLVWADCESDVFAIVKATKLSVDGVISSRPDFALHIFNDWCEPAFDMYFRNK